LGSPCTFSGFAEAIVNVRFHQALPHSSPPPHLSR
jgi:hypothetical protein